MSTTKVDSQKQDTSQTAFEIQRLYIKDCSFEAPHSPEIFRQEWKPEVKLDINTNAQNLENDFYEVVLTTTATATMNDKNVFLAEVKQAGIFSIKGFTEEQAAQVLGSLCPNILFPYAREAVSNLVVRGGFPPLYLTPINFDALYAQQLRQKQAKTEGAQTTEH